MAVRSWLQKNQVFDRDLVVLFPQYGVNNPETELKELSPQCWSELKLRLMTDRAAALKDSAARSRMQKKLTKVEKLWKTARAPAKSPRKKKHKKDLFSISTEKPKKNKKPAANTSKTSPASSPITIEKPKKTRKKSILKKPKNTESKQEENNNELKHKYATLEKDYKSKCDEFNKINKKNIKLTDLQSKYDALQEKNKALKKDCKALKQKENEFSQYKQSINNNNNDNDKQIQSLQAKYEIKCNELDKINSQINKQNVKINDLQFKYDTVTEKNKLLKKDCKTLRGKEDEFEEYKAKMVVNNSEKTDEISKKKEFESQIKSLHGNIDEKVDIINLLQSENEKLDEKMKQMEGKNAKYIERISEVENELGDVKNENLDKILKFEAEIENLLERNDKLKKSMKDITKNRRNKTKDDGKKYEELYYEFEEFKEIMENEQNVFEENEILLNDEITQIKLINNKKKTEIKKLQNKINILKSDLEKKEEELDELQCKYDDECENNKKPLDVDKIIAENKSEKLKVQNKMLENKYKKKAQQYSSVLKEYNEYIEQQNEESENMQNTIDELRDGLKKINYKYTNKENEYNKLEKEYDIVSKKLETIKYNEKNHMHRNRKKLPKNFLLKMQAKSSKEKNELEEYYEEYGTDEAVTPTSPASTGDIVVFVDKNYDDSENDTDGRRRSRKRKFKPNKKNKRSNSGTRLKPKPRSKSPNISQSKSKYASDIGINSDSIDSV